MKFLEFLPRTGNYINSVFQVGDERIEFGISNRLLAVWNVQRTDKIMRLLFEQIGTRKIQLMLAEDRLLDCILKTYDFEKSDKTVMNVDEVVKYLEDLIIETDEKNNEIGFKD